MTSPSTPLPEPISSDRAIQRACGVLIIAVLLLIALRWYTDCSRPRPVEITRTTHQIELNRAGRSELLQLPGVGAARADKILAYRASHGGFHSVDELREVNGIGDITLQRLKPHIRIEPLIDDGDEPVRLSRKPAATAKTAGTKPPPRTAKRAGTKPPLTDGPLDLNRASAGNLEHYLPGIGKTLAQRIVDERGRKPFAKVDDLRRVKGISATCLENLRQLVTVSD